MSELCDVQLVNHPFDKENEASLSHLYRSFCNHVTLGQWELARVCLKKLYTRQQLLKKPLKDVLRAVIDRPNLISSFSTTVISPLHLSWLCLVDYSLLYANNEDKLPIPISLTVQFHLLLYLNNWKTAPKHVIQELDDIYSRIVYKGTSSYNDAAAALSTNALQFLSSLLDENHELAHAFISQLSSSAKHFLENSQSLQNIYINSINRSLYVLTNEGNLIGSGSSPSLDQSMIDNTKKHLYQMLSLFNPTSDMLSLSKPLQSLFENLYQQSKVSGLTSLDIGTLYSCLLQRPTSFLIQKFCQVENRLRFPCKEKENGEVTSSGGRYSAFSAYVGLSKSDPKESMKCRFFHALDGNHVLENVVETSLSFIKEGDFNNVTKLLMEFSVLKPLVLLLGWPYCYSCENAKQLLDTLWDQKAEIHHPLLYQACEKLAYQVQLVQWCLQKAGLLLASNEAGSTHHQQASEMFQGLESHSVLRVLHKSVSLAQLPEKEVFALLRKRPVFSPESGSERCKGRQHTDTEMRSVSDDQPEEQLDPQEGIHPDVQRDLILYHSFCAMKSFMDCIVNPEVQSCSTKECFGFMDKLLEGRKHLIVVFPLTYRVEILENIFSLIFTTYEDLYSENTHHESDDLDTADDETKSLNTSLTGSLESLASIASSDVTSAESSPFKEPEQHSTPESSYKIKGHSRVGSHGSKKQLFQLLKTVTASEVKTTKGTISGEMQTSTLAKMLNLGQSRCRHKSDGDSKKPSMGFVMNNEAVSEYLKILKECLVDINAQKLEGKHSENSPIYNEHDWIYTSVGASILEQRISRLSQFIVEAQWRYQLVSWTADTKRETTSNAGVKSKQKQAENTVTEKVKSIRTSSRSEKNHHGSNGEDLLKNDEISGESSSYLSQDVTTGTEDGAGTVKVSKKLRKVTRNGRRPSLTETFVVRDDSTVARMLSSPETLIFMCLRKNSYDRAQQVIKMFNMQGKPSAKEAIFAEKFSNSYKELSSLQPRTRQALSSQKSSKKLGAVALAAASGVSSTVTSSLIDHLLALPIASPMILYNLDPTDEDIRNSAFFSNVHPDLLPAMVCIDLACTANVSQDVCKKLLDTAKSRLPKAMDATVKAENGLVGVSNILTDFYQLIQPNTVDTPASSQPNLVEVLSGRESLQVKFRNLSRKCENEQQESLKRMARALDEGDASIIAVQESASKAISPSNPQELQASFSLVQKSLSVRVGLTELQKSYSCTVDHATVGVFNKRERFDYLRSLLNHVDTLATLLLHWHSKPDDFFKETGKSVALKASNPFVVLNKGIAETFGKPMFEKNVSPKRLEGICKQLNINLVKVIVYNCCQHIPSNGLVLNGYNWPSSKPMVLNDDTHWLENAREPSVVAKELLSKMVELLTDVAKNNNGVVDSTCASLVVCSPQFSSIVQATSELQKVNLDLLQTNEDKLCFFINVLNLLIAHASLLKFSTAENEQHFKRLSHHGSLSNLLKSTSVGSTFDSRQAAVSSVDRISFLKHHCYAIGQMGPTSAFDLLFVIIRSGMFPPTIFGSAIQLCYPERHVDDPKRKYKPNHHDKRVVFAVSDGCLSSPDLQVYDADHLEVQLHAAAMVYVNRNVTISANQVVLPELLKWYQNDFTNAPITDLESSLDRTSQGTNANFLLLLEPYLNSKKAELLQSVLPNIKDVSYSPFCWTFGYQFDVSSLDHSESSSSLYRSSSVPDSLHLSLELSGTSSMIIIENRGKFSPSPSALEYIRKASPLVSTLVELVCSKHNETSGQGQLHSVLSNDMCFISLLKKMTGYPTLQRCLASRVYCIAEFLTTASEGIDFSGSYEILGADSKNLICEDDIVPKIKCIPLVLSAKDSIELQQAYQKASDFFLRQGNFYNLLELIRTTNLHSNGGCGDTMDYLLASAVLSKAGSSGMFAKRLDAALSDFNLPSVGFTHKWIKKPQTLLAQIKDNDQLAQLVLSNIKVLKAKVGLDLLNLAISRPSRNTALRKELQHRRQELSLHNKIASCAKAPQLRITDEPDSSQPPALLTQIPVVASLTIDNPSEIMEFLLSIQQYELASSWANLHGLPSEYHKTIKEKHLKYLLDSSPEDTMKAYCILEEIQEQHMALEICQSLLHQKLHVSQVLFIIQFMLTNLQPHLSPLRIEELLLTKMGAKALLCIPEMARPSYEHLVSRPYLLLEQLLMNLKVEWAAQVFSRLQVDLSLMKDRVIEEGSHSCSVDAFDALLANYSAKALEFQVVQTQHSPEDSLRSTDFLAAPSTPFTSSYASHSPTLGIDIPHKDLNISLSQSISSVKRTQANYIPPAIPPSKEEWVPDAQAMECVICKEPFSMFNRRHHCRRCGRVVCGTCSRHNCIVPGYGNTAVRVCDSCYSPFEVRSETADKTRVQSSPIQTEASSLTKKSGHEKRADTYGTSPYAMEVKVESEEANKWKLSLDQEMNSALRDEFYFEQAPSSSLCVAILDLHSDNLVCGRLLLDLCNTLSKKLVPIKPGVRNDEVDHNLIISMIRHLLFNAKLKMTKAGETGGLELCDTYLSHVELMKFLVESNCGDITSLQDLTRPDSARRLRDRFIEDERLSLAMEVSTKCGLEPSSVWAASGFACLQAGDLATAREKFGMCMKSSDGKLQQQQYSQFLDKIIEMLQTSPLISYSQSTDEILSPLRGLADHCKSSMPSGTLDSKRFDECLYYLRLYGSDTSTVAFYARHGHLKLACRYILEKKCHPDVFVESLLMRLISKGSLSAFKEQMEAADPSLQSWMPYLTASCRFLNKRGYHHLLYDFQLFMKDFFRAAQTCIRFFEGTTGTVTSQNDLFSRLDYLSKARSHIEAVIIEKKSPRSTALSASSWLRSHSTLIRKSSEELHHVSMTLSELTSYVNTINLQIEVTKFLHKCYNEGGNVAGLRVNNDEKLPTLFGSGRIKADLAIQILLSGSTIQDGFSLTARIIQDYNLPAGRVYVDAGRALARQYKFNHIQQLLNCVADVGLMSDKCFDDIILACVRIVSADQNQAKNVENLIKLLKSDSNKIDAFLLCGKLRSAYLIAVKEKNLEAVQMIAEEAQKTGQNKTLSLCKKWLSLNQSPNPT